MTVDGAPSTVLNDRAIRSALTLALAVDPDARLRHELPIGQGERRVDVAVVDPQEIRGYEIKSARDTLRRLDGQAALYSQVLDRMTLVATAQHLEHAAAVVPAWWGLTLAAGIPAAVTLTEVRPAGVNPAVAPAALVQMLWREEARSLLWLRGRGRGTSRLRQQQLHAAVVTAYPVLEDLRAGVRRMLLARPASWTDTVTGALP